MALVQERVLRVDWARMGPDEQREFYAQYGFLVVPGAVPESHRRELLRDIAAFNLSGTIEDMWVTPAFERLIETATTVAALEATLGSDLKFFRGVYVGTPPEPNPLACPERRALHVDYGIGEPMGNFKNSCASWVNVGYYLTGLTETHAPLFLVPGSHRLLHLWPGADLEAYDPVARIVLVAPGDAVLFHCFTVHAAGTNRSPDTRHALFYSYRPGWARPSGRVDEWHPGFVRRAPPQRRRLLLDLNGGLGPRPALPHD